MMADYGRSLRVRDMVVELRTVTARWKAKIGWGA